MRIISGLSAVTVSVMFSSGALAFTFSNGLATQAVLSTGPSMTPRVIHIPPACTVPNTKIQFGAKAAQNFRPTASNNVSSGNYLLSNITQGAKSPVHPAANIFTTSGPNTPLTKGTAPSPSTVSPVIATTTPITNPNGGRDFYVDPVNGSSSGDGSFSKPWRTLSEVISSKKIHTTSLSNGSMVEVNTKAPVKAGDRILLYSGDHGNVNLFGHANKDFITISALPGHTPVIRSLRVLGSSKWIFNELKFQNANDFRITPDAKGNRIPNTLVNFDGRSTFHGKIHDIIFVNNIIQSADTQTILQWGPKEWDERGSTGLSFTKTDCVTIAHNKIRNTRYGATVGGKNINFDNNEIDFYTEDGLRMVGVNNLNIRRNFITNHYGRMNNDNHNDAIQGFPLHTEWNEVMANILIDSNVIIESTGRYPTKLDNIPGTGSQNYIQGVSEFDGNWKDITVNNNLIVGSAWHLLVNLGGDGVKFTNNTIAGVTTNPKVVPWIAALKGKTGVVPQRVTITNNVTPKVVSHSPDGIIKDNLNSNNQAATFVKFDPANADYDFTLKDPKLRNVGAKLPNMKF